MIWTWLLQRPSRLVAAAGVAAIGILTVRLELALHEARVSRLAYVNIEAHADTTRVLFRDSLAGYTRLVEQLRVQGHPRLEAKGRISTARADLVVSVDTLAIDSVAGSNAGGTDTAVRHADIAVDSAGIHVRAGVDVPAPPAPSIWTLRSWVDPAAVTLELACEGDRARADVVGPPWLRIQLARVTESADVCNRPRALLPASWLRRHFTAGVSFGYGVVRDSAWHHGPGITAGITVHF